MRWLFPYIPRRMQLSVLMLAIVLVINFPIIVVVLNSFQTTAQILLHRAILRQLTWSNYEYLSTRTPFGRFLWNSLLVCGATAGLSLLCAVLAGYALSRYRSPVLRAYSYGLFAVQMFPIILALIPLFVMFRALGLINNPLSVIAVYTVSNLPFATWMARSFFDTIPRELEEAGTVDGCTPFQAFRKIVLPLSVPGLAAVAIFSFLFSYSEFFIASVFLRDTDAMTVPVGIQLFMQQYATDWGSLMAAATVGVVPTFVLFLLVQRYIVYGAVSAGVKG